MDHINVKVKALFQKFNNLSVSIVVPVAPTHEICGLVYHTGIASHVIAIGEHIQDMANYVNNFQRGNPYSNTYNLG